MMSSRNTDSINQKMRTVGLALGLERNDGAARIVARGFAMLFRQIGGKPAHIACVELHEWPLSPNGAIQPKQGKHSVKAGTATMEFR